MKWSGDQMQSAESMENDKKMIMHISLIIYASTIRCRWGAENDGYGPTDATYILHQFVDRKFYILCHEKQIDD